MIGHALRSRDDREDGFSLVELMVVVLIISILIAIAVPQYKKMRETTQDHVAVTQLRSALQAIQSYANENNNSFMGMTVADLTAFDPKLADATNLSIGGPWSANQMSVALKSATGTTFYIYFLSWSPNGAPVDPHFDRWCDTPGKGACQPYGVWGTWK